jgi:hypothetical protein
MSLVRCMTYANPRSTQEHYADHFIFRYYGTKKVHSISISVYYESKASIK